MKKNKFLICLITLIMLSNIVVFASYNVANINVVKEYKIISEYSDGLAKVVSNYVYGEKVRIY